MTPLERALSKVEEQLAFALNDDTPEHEGRIGSFQPSYGVFLSVSELDAVRGRLTCDGFCMTDTPLRDRHPVEQG